MGYKLIEAKEIPRKHLKKNIYPTVLEEFLRSQFQFAELKIDNNTKPTSVQMKLRVYIKQQKYNVSAHVRNGKIYLEKRVEVR